MSVQRKKKICKRCEKPKYIYGRGYCANCYKIEVTWRQSLKKKKSEKAQKKYAKKYPKTQIQKQRERTWDAFSLYIRARDADQNGICVCCTCGKRMKYKGKGNCQAGHYISRRHPGTRYDERNVHAQCAYCNKFLYGSPEKYATFLKLKYGSQILDELFVQKVRSKRFSYPELVEMEREYKKRYLEIKIRKGLP